MKFSEYGEENTSLMNRALWWKTYQDHDIDKIRQLRGRMNAGIKIALCKVCGINFLSTLYVYHTNIHILSRVYNR